MRSWCRLTEISQRELRKVYTKLRVAVINNDHIRGWVVHEGRPLIPLRYSHSKPLNGWAAEDFIKSLGLSKREFAALVACTFSREQVVQRALEK